MPASVNKLAAVIAVLVLALPVTAGAQDLEQAARNVDDLQGRLAAATEAYETTLAELEVTRQEHAELADRAQQLEAELADAEDAIADRAIAMFKHGSTRQPGLLLAADGAQEALDRASMLAALQVRERSRAEQAAALRIALEQTQLLLASRVERLDQLQVELDRHRDTLNGQLTRAEVVLTDLRAREARRRQIARGAQQGTYACIFDPGRFSFRDSWGAPRSGGRRHRGTDVFAAMGEPTFAFTNGVIQRHSSNRLGGIGLYLRGNDGNVYYYAHLQRIDAGGAVGRRVEAGELIAYNGDTGNARGGSPHVHFEVHPGGGAAINPYPWLAAACF